VFVGYGIDAPKQGWDDYKGTDVAGNVLLMLVNEPQSTEPELFDGPGLTYFGRWTYRFEEAARRGAVGAICIHRDDMAGSGWDVIRNSWDRERAYVNTQGDGNNKLRMASWVRDGSIAPVLRDAGFELEELIERANDREFRPVDLGLRVRGQVVTKVRSFESPNVIGVIRGSDRPDEAVIYTAHYDHLGVHPDLEGDGIFNGAVDNASGCAALLEVARMFANMDPPPSRSVAFLFVTAEEGGLRGSEYYAAHPTFAPENIAAAINLDGLPVIGEPTEYEPLGYDRSSLRKPMEDVARAFGVTLLPDRNPEQGYFFRSDHFSFAKIGVPAINLRSEGHDTADYRAHRYHQPSDEYDPSWDLIGVVKTARIAFALGALIADAEQMPTYDESDEFKRN